ncbi:methyltransferase domain-containing protein [Sorangium sp. So ce1151]|uniref:methyltransferase domain-containing protein n=1 Tax=Sorangium sp. So ce1151 TaxID=3133332 RepID=UPI003F5E7652
MDPPRMRPVTSGACSKCSTARRRVAAWCGSISAFLMRRRGYIEPERNGRRRGTARLEPRNVVDLGCGIGTWLTVFKENGVSDIQGIDGDHVDRKALPIPQDRFTARDLGRQLTLDRRFDLAVSLEVAERRARSVAPDQASKTTSGTNIS